MKAQISSLLIILLFGIQAFAALEFPPPTDTLEERIELSKRIRNLIPETTTSSNFNIHRGVRDGSGAGIENYILQEARLVNTLKADPRYMEAANARPALQTFTFQRYKTVEKKGVGATEEWVASMSDLKPKNSAELANLIGLAAKHSSTHIFSGLSRFLQNEQRQFLGDPDLNKRWRAIAGTLAAIPLEQLRHDFDIHRFGVEEMDWTIVALTDLVAKTDLEEKSIARFIQLSYEENYGRNAGLWFADSSNSDRVFEILPIDAKNKAVVGFIDALGKRMQKLFTSESATIRTQVLDREITIQELPPWLGIYRGCVGNDCSTSHSWPYPYSPYERTWLAKDTHGVNIGYISGNITLVDGKPCLYIRDVTGPELADKPDSIPMILTGFYLAREYYGADQMTILPLTFVGENHFPVLQQQLTKFPSVRETSQTFQDEWIRTTYLDPYSQQSYDHPRLHQRARVISLPRSETENFKVVPVGGQVEVKTDIWTELELAVNANDPSLISESLLPQGLRISSLIRILRNEDHLPVLRYEENVKESFEAAHIEFSNNIRKKNESLFSIGFLNAPDAFEGADNQHRAVRYVIGLIWRTRTPETAIDYLLNHLEVFETDELMTRQVQGLFERHRPEDVPRLKVLWNAGYRFKDANLDIPARIWAIEHLNDPRATVEITKTILAENPASADFVEQLGTLGRLLENGEEQEEDIAIQAAEILWNVPHPFMNETVYSEVKDSIYEEDNSKIRYPLAILFLREGNFKGHTAVISYRILTQKLERSDLSEIWKARGREVLANIEPANIELLQSQLEEYQHKKNKHAEKCDEVLDPQFDMYRHIQR